MYKVRKGMRICETFDMLHAFCLCGDGMGSSGFNMLACECSVGVVIYPVCSARCLVVGLLD